MTNNTILVVDDEELLRNALVFQFKREGFNVLSASNGKEAFEIIKTNKIDAVVSDIQMPGGNGIELLKDVKNYDVEIPVLVFITAFADLTEADAYDLGANAIFSKPFDRKALVKCIKDAVTHKGRTWKVPSGGAVELKTLSGKNVAAVGRGGVFVSLDEPNYSTGEQLLVSLSAQIGSETVELKGKAQVRWTRTQAADGPTGVGLEFLHLEPESIPAYDRWLDSHSVRPYIPKK